MNEAFRGMCLGFLDRKAKHLQSHIALHTFQNFIRLALLLPIEWRTDGLQCLHKVISAREINVKTIVDPSLNDFNSLGRLIGVILQGISQQSYVHMGLYSSRIAKALHTAHQTRQLLGYRLHNGL